MRTCWSICFGAKRASYQYFARIASTRSHGRASQLRPYRTFNHLLVFPPARTFIHESSFSDCILAGKSETKGNGLSEFWKSESVPHRRMTATQSVDQPGATITGR